MPRHHSRHPPLPEDLPLLKVLAELAGVLLVLLGLKAADFIRWVVWPETPSASKPASAASRTATMRLPPLQWRNPWWAWQLLAWVIATVTAPTFLLLGSLLLVDARSDHPLFWWSLPVIVAIGNAVAIPWINQQHHRAPFTDPRQLARRHAFIGTVTGAMLFLISGMVSGFLPDLVPTLVSPGTALPVLGMTLWSAGLATVFAILSFPFAGAVHAGLCFEIADQRQCHAALTR